MAKGKHRKDKDPDDEEDEKEDDGIRHYAKRFKVYQVDEEENEASGKELSCYAPVESSTDVAEPSLHVSTEAKETSALVSEDQGKLFCFFFLFVCF